MSFRQNTNDLVHVICRQNATYLFHTFTDSNPFSWSAQGTIGVALTDNVYSWNVLSGPVKTVAMKCDAWTDDNVPCVTAVTWDPHGRYLALGTEAGHDRCE